MSVETDAESDVEQSDVTGRGTGSPPEALDFVARWVADASAQPPPLSPQPAAEARAGRGAALRPMRAESLEPLTPTLSSRRAVELRRCVHRM
jgi:hypothetical protein